MKKICSIIAVVACGLVSAHADDTLYINFLNNNETVTAQIVDTSDNINVNAFVGSINETLVDENNTVTPLPMMFCDDIIHDIGVPTSYPVSVSMVDNSAVWMIEHFASPSNSISQDAGLQMAIWAVTFPGVQFSNVDVLGGPDGSPLSWMNTYLTADNYLDSNGVPTGNAHTAWGIQYTPTTSYGQGMIGTPGPAAALPFLVGLIRRKKRNN